MTRQGPYIAVFCIFTSLLTSCTGSASPGPIGSDAAPSPPPFVSRRITAAVRASPTVRNGVLDSGADTVEELVSARLVHFQRTRYMNPELDALADRYFSTVPTRERLEALKGIVHHMTDQVGVVPVFHVASI